MRFSKTGWSDNARAETTTETACSSCNERENLYSRIFLSGFFSESDVIST